MQNNIFEAMIAYNQTALDTLKKITQTNMEIGEQLIQQQMDLAQCMMEDGAKAAEEISSCKTMQDFAEKQASCVEETRQNILQSAQSCADILAEANQTYTDLFEEGMNAFGQAAPKKSATKSRRKAA